MKGEHELDHGEALEEGETLDEEDLEEGEILDDEDDCSEEKNDIPVVKIVKNDKKEAFPSASKRKDCAAVILHHPSRDQPSCSREQSSLMDQNNKFPRDVPYEDSRKRKYCNDYSRSDESRHGPNDKRSEEIPKRIWRLCKHYRKKGKCAFRYCPFMHEDYPCQFFHTGRGCFKEGKCKYYHGKLSPVQQDILKEVANKKQAPMRKKRFNGPDSRLDFNRDRDSDQRGTKIPSLFEINVKAPNSNGKNFGRSNNDRSFEKSSNRNPCNEHLRRNEPKSVEICKNDMEDRSCTPTMDWDDGDEDFGAENVEPKSKKRRGDKSPDKVEEVPKLPKRQKALFLRLRNRQREKEEQVEEKEWEVEQVKDEIGAQDDNWYSSDEDEQPISQREEEVKEEEDERGLGLDVMQILNEIRAHADTESSSIVKDDSEMLFGELSRHDTSIPTSIPRIQIPEYFRVDGRISPPPIYKMMAISPGMVLKPNYKLNKNSTKSKPQDPRIMMKTQIPTTTLATVPVAAALPTFNPLAFAPNVRLMDKNIPKISPRDPRLRDNKPPVTNAGISFPPVFPFMPPPPMVIMHPSFLSAPCTNLGNGPFNSPPPSQSSHNGQNQ